MINTYIITGPYGGGKTEFCVNLALKTAAETGKVIIADLDVVNPYFRSREKAEKLAPRGIEVMGDCLNNNTGQDLPAVSYAFLSHLRRGDNVIIDLAGGTLGLNLLASCYEAVRKISYEFLCVLNLFRPETGSAEKMADFVREINAKSKIAVTGLVNNGHMLHGTTAEHVLASQAAILAAGKELNLPLKYTLVRQNVYDTIKSEIKSEKEITFDSMIMRESWQ